MAPREITLRMKVDEFERQLKEAARVVGSLCESQHDASVLLEVFRFLIGGKRGVIVRGPLSDEPEVLIEISLGELPSAFLGALREIEHDRLGDQ